jgi:thiopeptide-type bacteriocin biosynthesis protein
VSSAPSSGWLSGHIFFNPDEEGACDRLILDVVEPFLHSGLSHMFFNSYFFIRYAELGPHVRIRVKLKGGSRDAVQILLEECIVRSFPARLLSVPTKDPPQNSQRSSLNSLVWIPYVPEVDRYGGSKGIGVAEAFFQDSTEVSFGLLHGIVAGKVDRQAAALVSMATLLGALTKDTACAAKAAQSLYEANAPPGIDKEFDRGFAGQTQSLTNQIAAFWNGGSDGLLPSPLDAYAQAGRRVRTRLERLIRSDQLAGPNGSRVRSIGQAIEMLAVSYMHMTNNRLGISNLSEAFLGYSVWQVLKAPPS